MTRLQLEPRVPPPSPMAVSAAAAGPGGAQSPQPAGEPVIVTSAEALRDAVLAGVRDIEIRRHLDLTTLRRQPTQAPYGLASAFHMTPTHLMYVTDTTRSIRVRPTTKTTHTLSHSYACLHMHAKPTTRALPLTCHRLRRGISTQLRSLRASKHQLDCTLAAGLAANSAAHKATLCGFVCCLFLHMPCEERLLAPRSVCHTTTPASTGHSRL